MNVAELKDFGASISNYKLDIAPYVALWGYL